MINTKLVPLIKDYFLITLGVFSAAFGLKGFILASNFIDGGTTGVSLLIGELTTIPIWMLIICVNIPFVFLGYRVIGKQFAYRTSMAIAMLALVLALFPFPFVTKEPILAAIFGGFFLGAGIGFSIRGGAVIDGTEVMAIYLSRKTSLKVGDVIIIINAVIFGFAAYFLGIEVALYSLIAYLSATKTLDFIIEGIDEYTGVTIITNNCEAIRTMIIEKMGRGVTVYNGKRGFGKNGENTEIEIIYTVITRLELNKLNTEIERIDPNAFIVMNSVKDTKGGMIKKRPLSH